MREPHQHYTFWTGRSASRIDRFYVAADLGSQVQWEGTELPKRQPDHQAVTLTLQQVRRKGRVARRLPRLEYPIRAEHDEEMLDKVRDRVSNLWRAIPEKERITWDEGSSRLKEDLRRLRREEARWVRAATKLLQQRRKKPRSTRRNFIAADIAQNQEAGETRFGVSLTSSHDSIRHFYRRISNWSRDQTVTALTPKHSATSPNASVANTMAAEWQHIISVVHSPMSATARAHLFDKSVIIPASRKVTADWNAKLTAEIVEAEVATALSSLARHKAPGPDQIPNDFFVDCRSELVPWLTPMFNRVLQGKETPASFAEGMIIPLRKNGDFDYALDYRPITLLSTYYKVFTKVIASRLQTGLQHVIGVTQQGFVRKRLLERSVILMQSVLHEAFEDEHMGTDEAPAGVLLNFMKAYDTLNRDFILLALQCFGFANEFVQLVGRLHENTRAHFLVNGQLSEVVPVTSGIRQGCPLAPCCSLSRRKSSR